MMTVIKAVTWGVAVFLMIVITDVTWDTVLSLHARGDVLFTTICVALTGVLLLVTLVLGALTVIRMAKAHNLYHS